MLIKELPTQIDIFALKKASLSGKKFTGAISFAQLPQLQGLLENYDGVVSANIEFSIDNNGLVVISGYLEALLPVLCQRCMLPLSYEMKSNFLLSPITNDSKASRLPDKYEPIIIKNGIMSVSGLLTEEILLNLPRFPKHLEKECSVKLWEFNGKINQNKVNEPKKSNPFEILVNIK